DADEPLDLIGKGSFGKIRRVRRKSDGKIFARKELEYEKMGEQDKKQLVAEVNILRVMSHANIVKYEDRFVDVDDKILYIIMEYCDGGDLGGLIKKCRKTNTLLPEETVWSYLAQMTSGLHACHNRMVQPEEPSTGLPSAHSTSNIVTQRSVILHRDLKPENVFLDGDQRVKLGDFGLSKEMQTDFTATYVGTPYYMSPELSEGKRYDTKSDIWALGCIAYELCALSPPFDAKTQEELTRKIRLGKVPRLPTAYSEGLGHIINSMLQLEPRRRPSTTDMLAHPMVEVQLRSLELLDM
ncbi:kinase-like protein, partial [Tilletiaria anomala UBC 951]